MTNVLNSVTTITIPVGERALILEDSDVIFSSAETAINSLEVVAIGTENPELFYDSVDNDEWVLESEQTHLRNYLLELQDQDLEPPVQ